MNNYWLGIQCSPVPAPLRSHLTLPEKSGLLVMDVMKDSPAARASPSMTFYFASATNRLPSRAATADSRRSRERNEAKIDLFRGGKPQTIEATPAKRPEESTGGPVPVPDQADWDTIQGRWRTWRLDKPAQDLTRPCSSAFGPGAIVPGETCSFPGRCRAT